MQMGKNTNATARMPIVTVAKKAAQRGTF